MDVEERVLSTDSPLDVYHKFERLALAGRAVAVQEAAVAVHFDRAVPILSVHKGAVGRDGDAHARLC